MLSKWEDVVAIRSNAKSQLPEWAILALRNNSLVSLNLTGDSIAHFVRELEHAFGYLKTVPNVFRVGVQQAIREGEKKIARDNKRASLNEGLIKELHCFPDGFRFVSLLDDQALIREGKLMQHCVGNEGQEYRKLVTEGKIEIWSLRASQNIPHCTIEFRLADQTIAQIEGKRTRLIGQNQVNQKFQELVLTFIKSNGALIQHINAEALLNIGLVQHEGKFYDLFNLPDNLTVSGNLYLGNTKIKRLPGGLRVLKELSINDTDISQLPDDLFVGTTLDLS